MIAELRITDLGVISDAAMSFHPGLTVVTGETGAGKTMIITGLGLLLGWRADPKLVRSGAERARIEGRFVAASSEVVDRMLAAGGELDADGELLVARHLTASGRSRAFLGGASVPAGLCTDVTADLVTIHGQSEQLRLAEPDRQRRVLDKFAGPAVCDPLDAYGRLWGELQAARSELAQLRDKAQSRAREIDLLRFGLDEIEKIAPGAGEDLALAADAHRLQAADDLRAAAQSAVLALAGSDDEAGGALAWLSVARKALEAAQGDDVEMASLSSRLADTSYALTDITADLVRYLDALDGEPGRLEQIAARRAQLNLLTRKYGTTCDEVLGWAAEAAVRLQTLEDSDDRIMVLTSRIDQLSGELAVLAERISAARRQAADRFGAQVLEELAALAMPHATLRFQVSSTELGPHGADAVDLLFSANAGMQPRSVGKVASGGELSRVRLALEVVLAAGREARTLVFDEIDAGVGGRVAVEIGRRLARLSQDTQVIVVTHLAQVAAFADRHYVVV
ncbi:MAG TPA: DNA repair protein RecN, partial [Propionibacteriaceae bacterium]|nr:DNA repair protein RecN [Propionibacteriaceae bacterium]